jgi:uncharacterized membrane protein
LEVPKRRWQHCIDIAKEYVELAVIGYWDKGNKIAANGVSPNNFRTPVVMMMIIMTIILIRME